MTAAKENLKLTCLACGQVNRVPAQRLGQGPKCAACAQALVDGDVAAIDATVHDKATKTDELPLIVDYWAPWCRPCRMMAPDFAKAASAMKARTRFAKIDTEQFPHVSQRLQIRGIPLLILYVRGREVARLTGARPASDIEGFVRQHL